VIDKCSKWIQITEKMCGALYMVPNKKKVIKTAALQMTS
jgi:hypothetical protein